MRLLLFNNSPILFSTPLKQSQHPSLLFFPFNPFSLAQFETASQPRAVNVPNVEHPGALTGREARVAGVGRGCGWAPSMPLYPPAGTPELGQVSLPVGQPSK